MTRAATKSAKSAADTKQDTSEETVADSWSCNVAVVRGACSSDADVRVLGSGQVLAQLQVTTRTTDQALSVPVAVWSPAAWVEGLTAGDEVMVVGRVRRRFFRTATGTASRVELEADYVARASDRRQLAAARRRLDEALAVLGG
jgi:single-strand DNA-binding protein